MSHWGTAISYQRIMRAGCRLRHQDSRIRSVVGVHKVDACHLCHELGAGKHLYVSFGLSDMPNILEDSGVGHNEGLLKV